MNKALLIFFLVIGSFYVQAQPGTTDSTMNGSVFFMRYSGFYGPSAAYHVFIDGELVCRVYDNRYSVHSVTQGKHFFSVQFAKKYKMSAEKIDITIEPGKRYFVQLILRSGAFAGILYCQEVTENSARKVFPYLRDNEGCK